MLLGSANIIVSHNYALFLELVLLYYKSNFQDRYNKIALFLIFHLREYHYKTDTKISLLYLLDLGIL